MWRPFKSGLFVDDLQEGAEGAEAHAALVLVFFGTHAERSSGDVGGERRLGVARGVVAEGFDFGPHVLELLLVQARAASLCVCAGVEERFALHGYVCLIDTTSAFRGS